MMVVSALSPRGGSWPNGNQMVVGTRAMVYDAFVFIHAGFHLSLSRRCRGRGRDVPKARPTVCFFKPKTN